MLSMKKVPVVLLIGLLFVAACSSEESSPTSAIATSSPMPTATEFKPLPTPSSPGDSIRWDELRVTMLELEITQEYVTDYGSRRIPPAGKKFLWAHLQLTNVGRVETSVPRHEHFSMLYAGLELKPTYGHRRDYVDYTTLGNAIFPNQTLDGWLRFDIPAAAGLPDMRFVFLPESSQVGASLASPNYPYAEDKPTFVWNCGP